MSEQKKVSVEELNQLVEDILTLEDELEVLTEEAMKPLKEKKKVIEGLYARGTLALAEIGQDKFQSPKGSLERKTHRSFKLPVGDEKTLFLDKLKELGVYEEMVSVNSNTLNAFLNADYKDAEARGEDMILYSFPGVGAPSEMTTTEVKRTKEKKKK